MERNPSIKVKYDDVQTLNFNLIGSYSRQELLTGMIPSKAKLTKQYEEHLNIEKNLDMDVTRHLLHTYGTSCVRVVSLGEE